MPSNFDDIMGQAGERAKQAERARLQGSSGTVAAQVREYVAGSPDDNWTGVARAICARHGYDIEAVHPDALTLVVQVRSAYYRISKAERGDE